MKKNRIIVAAVLTLSLMLSAIPAFAATTTDEKTNPVDKTTTSTPAAITTTAPAVTTTTPAVTTTTPAVTTTVPAVEITVPAIKATPDAIKTETITATVSLNSLNIKVNDTVVAVPGEYYALADGTEVPFSVLYNGTTYLPMRKVGELVGKDIAFDNATKTASINSTTAAVTAPVASKATAKDGIKESVTFSVNSLNISVDAKAAAKAGESYALADGSKVPFSLLYKGTTYLPMRKVGELVGLDITYDNATKTAQIKSSAVTTPVDKTADKEKVAAYKDYKNVPDFSVVTKMKLLKTETIDGRVVYSYDVSKLTDDTVLDAYQAALEAYGYEVVKDAKIPSFMTEGIACTNKADKTTLYVGATADAKAKTATFYIAIEQGK